MIKVLIIDDEQSAIDVLKDLLIPYKNYTVCGIALDVQTAVELTYIEKPDLVLLDIELRTKTGFDYLQTFLPNITFKVIFVTAYNKFAIKAFEFSALHYLLKPITSQSFMKALSRMNDLLEERQYVDRLESLAGDLENNQHRYIFVNTTEKIYKLDIRDLLYLEAENNYTNFYLSNYKKVTSSKTLRYYQKQLDKDIFFRIHHAHLVNISKVKDYKKKQRELVLTDDIKLLVAVRREKDFLKAWREFKK